MNFFGRKLLLATVIGLGCGPHAEKEHDAHEPFPAIVVTSDYTSSAVGGIDQNGNGILRTGVDLGRDPELTSSRGQHFLIARDRDLIFGINSLTFEVLSVLNVHDSSRRSSNPYDIAIAPDGTQWAVLYNNPTVIVFDPQGKRLDAIDIAPYDNDGNPNASAIEIAGNTAFIALQRVDDADKLRSKQPSFVLRINTKTRRIDGHIQLLGRNPFPQMVAHEKFLYVFEPGNFDLDDEANAGIERIDTETGETTLIATKQQLGGSPTSLAIMDGCIAAIVANTASNVNATSLVTLALGGSAHSTHGFGPTTGFDLRGLAWVTSDTLLVGNRQKSANGFYPVHVFERDLGAGKAECALRHKRDNFISHPPVSLQPTMRP